MNQQAPILVNVLAGLLRQRGSALLGDRRRTLGLLRDRVPTEGRAIRILMTAFDQGVPARLSRGPVSELDIGREVALLADETGISLERAREAVETWAVAVAHAEAPPPLPAAPLPPVAALPPVAPLPPVAALPPVAPLPPVEALPPVAALPAQAATGAVPSPSRSPRAQPVTVRQVLKGPSRSTAPSPPTDPAPTGRPEDHVAPVAAEPAPVQPLPVQPLSVQPLPVRPVQRLPDPAFAQHPPGNPEAGPAAAPSKGAGLKKWSGLIISILLAVSGAAKLIGAFSSDGRSAPPPASASPAGKTTAEGVAIIAPGQAWPTYRFQRLKDDPATLAFVFGLSYKGQSYTYYSAFALDTGKTTGASKLVLVHGDQEISSEAFPIEVYTGLKTKYFIESVGKISNTYGAPNLCVFLNVDPRIDRLDPIASGSIGIYGVDATGSCDLNTSFGYANLKP